jgi:type 1 glutamine amidotransferase/sugar phosphate isomerase/epimerase
MKNLLRVGMMMIAIGSIAGSAQQSSPAVPAVPVISKRPTGASLSTIRAGAQDPNIWFAWRVGTPTTAVKGQTFSEALAIADINGVPQVEASSTQLVANEIPKPLDYRLQTGERNAVNYRLKELTESVMAYRIDTLPTDAETLRKVFDFAKAIGAPMIITGANAASIAGLDKIAEEFGVNVALESKSDPKRLMATLASRSNRIGLAANLDGWVASGVKPVEGLPLTRGRLMYITAADRSSLGGGGKKVELGAGAAGLGDFFLAAYKSGLRPISISIESPGTTEAEYVKNLAAFERVMWPAMAERVRVMVDSAPGKIRGPDKLTADQRARIEAGVPKQAVVKPLKPRKLLVTDLQMYSGHTTIPHGNYMLELMAKTGAFTPTFSNDLNLLKYPAIKQFDAIFLNNVCGMIHNDPEVREGILRFVREGGGIAGNHAVTFANNNWPEFADMMGGWAGAHHTENQVIKIDDPDSPLTRSFGSASFEHTDEFYQFPVYSPYSREKQHVLLSIDVEKSDRATGNRLCEQCTRPDQDYGLAWIRTYGKGRTYFTPLGHTEIMYTDPRWTQHILAATQYVLGDLDADATPSAKLAKKK